MILEHKDLTDCDRKYLERGSFVIDKYPNVVTDLYIFCCHYHCIIWYSGCYSNHMLFKTMAKYKKDYMAVFNQMSIEEQKEIGICFINITESLYIKSYWGSVLEIVETNWEFEDIDFDLVSWICIGLVIDGNIKQEMTVEM